MSHRLFDGTLAAGKIRMFQRHTFWELDLENETEDIQLDRDSHAQYDSDIEYWDCCDKEESIVDIVDECDETDSICSLTTLEELGSSTQFVPTPRSRSDNQDLADDDGTIADAE